MKNATDKLRISIRRPVTVAMIFLGAVVFGVKSYQELALNLMPDLSYPTLTVRTEYPEAAPEEVENFVSRPLEEALGTVSNLVEIQSISSAGLSEVMLEFAWGTDMDLASLDVREKMDRVFFPEGVVRPTILRYNPALDPILRLGIYGDQDLFTLRRIAEKELKPQVEGLVGVASVKVKGGLEKEVLVEVDEGRLAERGISMEQLAQRLWQENINLAGGSLKEGRAEYLVRTLNEFVDLNEIEDVVIGRKVGGGGGIGLPGWMAAAGALAGEDAAEVKVKDVATVRWGHKKQTVITRINRMESVEVEVYKEADSNTVEVADRLKEVLGLSADKHSKKDNESHKDFMKLLMEDYPGVKIEIISDPSRFIKSAIREVRSAALLGGVLALIVLFLFLRDLRSTLIIGLSIPVSILMTFIPMFVFDVSLNMMSLGGLALGIGMLVDNSIVVLESIFRCREEGDGVKAASNRGTGEVAAAITASTLTTVAVFFPIIFVKGIAGQLFNDLALTVTFSLLGSLLVALYLIPMLASRQVSLKETSLPFRPEAESLWAVFRTGLRNAFQWLAENGRPQRWMTEAGAYLAARSPSPDGNMRGGMKTEDGSPSGEGKAPDPRQGMPSGKLRPLLRIYGLFHPLVEAFRFLLLLVLRLFEWTAGFFVILLFRLFAPVFFLGGRLLKVLLLPFLFLFESFMKTVNRAYPVLLRACLRHRAGVILVSLLIFLHCLSLLPRIGTELIPRIHQGQFTLHIEYPMGTPLEETSKLSAPIEAMVLEEPEVETVFNEVGSEASAEAVLREQRGENTAEFTVTLKDIGKNVFQEDALIDRLRHRLKEFVGVRTKFLLPSLFTFKTPVGVEIEGNNFEELRRIAGQVEKRMRTIPGLIDIRASTGIGNPEVQVEFDRDRLAQFGLDASKAARIVQAKILGDIPTRLSDQETRYDIRVRADRRYMKSLEDLRDLKIDLGPERSVPLDSLARIRILPGPGEIRRIGQHRVAEVTANLKGMDLGSVSNEITEKLEDMDLPPGYRIGLGGQNREMQTSFSSLQFALLLAVFLVYIVMASQFESLLHPFVILFSIPLGLIGVIYILYLLHVPLSIVVFIGVIMLAGIMVNDAIVLVDYINILRRRGVPRLEAIVQGGHVRLRPILMTTLTTILGLLPMALGLGEGAEIRMPMALTVIAGLTGSTFLTLVVIPVVYSLVDRKT